MLTVAMLRPAMLPIEDVVEPSYKPPTRKYSNHAGNSRKIRGELASSNTYSKMSEIAFKGIKRYVDNPKYGSKHTSLIHVPIHSSD